MNPFTKRLAGIEARLQALFEDQIPRILPNGRGRSDLIYALVKAMSEGSERDASGEILAPNKYLIRVPEKQAYNLDDLGQLEALAGILQQVGVGAGFRFVAHPAVRMERLPASGAQDIQVLAWVSHEQVSETAAMEAGSSADAVRLGAYLVVDGMRRFDLVTPSVDIGRSSDNHLVIDDPRVSRFHARIRLDRRVYEIVDLESKGGTWIDGSPIQRHALEHGDLISIAGVPLVYYQAESDLPDTHDFIRAE